MRDTASLNIGRESLYSLISKLVMALVGFGGAVVFARLLGPSGLGVYQTALAAAFICTQISGGVGGAIQKRVSEVGTDPREFFGAGLLLHTGIVALVIVGLWAFSGPIIAYFGSVEVALGALAVVATRGLFNVVNRTYSGIGYPARSSWLDTVRSVLTVAAQLVLLWLGMEAFGLLIGLAVGTLASAVLSAFAAGVRPSIPRKKTLDRVYSFAKWSVPNGLLTDIYSKADIMIITAIVGSAASGLYSVALQLVMPAALLAGSIQTALGVRTSGRSSVGEPVVQDLLNALSYTGLFAVPILFGAFAMPRAIPRTLFGPEFAAAGTALVGLALFQVGNVYAKPFESSFRGIDKPEVVVQVNVLILAIHLPLATALGLKYGLNGVVTATVTAELIRLIVYQVLAYHEFERVALARPIFEQFLSGAVMYLAIEGALTVVGVDNWMVLMSLIGGGAVLYFGVLLAISSHFRLSLDHALPFELALLKSE